MAERFERRVPCGVELDEPVASVDGSSRRAPGATDRVEARFVENYVHFQYHLVEFVTEHLIDLSQAFEGDLQQVLVLAMIGQIYLHEIEKEGRPATHGTAPCPVGGITSSRIADITHIPRETVRRKLEALHQRGWIEPADPRGWRLAWSDGWIKASAELRALDERGVRRGARLCAAFSKHL